MAKSKLKVLAATFSAAALATVAPVHASHTPAGVAQCNRLTYTVNNPPTLLGADPGAPQSTALAGAVRVGGQTLKSTMVCTGAVTGVAGVNGSIYICDNNHTGTTFTCSGQAGATPTPDEGIYQSHASVQGASQHVYGVYTITSDPSAPLRDVFTGETFGTCTQYTSQHLIARAAGATAYWKLDCLGSGAVHHVWKGVATATTALFMGPSGDVFSNADAAETNPPPCSTYQATPNKIQGQSVPFVPGVGYPNCFRASASSVRITFAPGVPF